MNELKKCPFCGSDVKWCGENEPDPEDNHLCDHIECTNADCGADFSFTHNNDIYPDNSDDMTPEELMQIDRDYSAQRFNRRATKRLDFNLAIDLCKEILAGETSLKIKEKYGISERTYKGIKRGEYWPDAMSEAKKQIKGG